MPAWKWVLVFGAAAAGAASWSSASASLVSRTTAFSPTVGMRTTMRYARNRTTTARTPRTKGFRTSAAEMASTESEINSMRIFAFTGMSPASLKGTM